MTAQELSNLGVCGAGESLGFNTDKGCADIIKAAQAVWLISPNVTIAETQEISLSYIQSLQKSGDLIVVKGINTFEENGSDDAFETLEDDTKILTNKGKYNFMATFTHGMYFHQALGSIEGFGNWRTIYVDNEGSILLTQLDNGGLKGFRTGQITRKKLMFPSNTTSLKEGLEWQLLDRYELDDNYVLWQQENLGFDARQVEPITQVELTYVNAPADTDTTLTVKAVVRRGRKDAVQGLTFSQFLFTVDGATSNPTADDSEATGPGIYVLTISAIAAGEAVKLSLYDNSNNYEVIEIVGDGLYKSNTASATVV